MLSNDDVHTFEYVIDSLVEVFGHTPEQAEQCAYLVHYNGKCDVKRGSLEEIRPLFETLCKKGLTAVIEK